MPLVRLSWLTGTCVAAICLLSAPVWAACPVAQVVGSMFTTAPGDVCPNGLSAGAGGVINAPTVTVPFTSVNPLADIAVEASNGGIINFTGGSTITASGAANAVNADGVSSLIDIRHGTQITVDDPGFGIEMSNGGLVLIDSTTVSRSYPLLAESVSSTRWCLMARSDRASSST